MVEILDRVQVEDLDVDMMKIMVMDETKKDNEMRYFMRRIIR